MKEIIKKGVKIRHEIFKFWSNAIVKVKGFFFQLLFMMDSNQLDTFCTFSPQNLVS